MDIKTIEEFKKQIEEQEEEKINTTKKQYEDLLGRVDNCISCLNEYGDKQLKEQDKEEIQKLTCWGNLAFCCSCKKGCLFRDTALEILGIDKEEFENYKKDKIDELVKNV